MYKRIALNGLRGSGLDTNTNASNGRRTVGPRKCLCASRKYRGISEATHYSSDLDLFRHTIERVVGSRVQERLALGIADAGGVQFVHVAGAHFVEGQLHILAVRV